MSPLWTMIHVVKKMNTPESWFEYALGGIVLFLYIELKSRIYFLTISRKEYGCACRSSAGKSVRLMMFHLL